METGGGADKKSEREEKKGKSSHRWKGTVGLNQEKKASKTRTERVSKQKNGFPKRPKGRTSAGVLPRISRSPEWSVGERGGIKLRRKKGHWCASESRKEENTVRKKKKKSISEEVPRRTTKRWWRPIGQRSKKKARGETAEKWSGSKQTGLAQKRSKKKKGKGIVKDPFFWGCSGSRVVGPKYITRVGTETRVAFLGREGKTHQGRCGQEELNATLDEKRKGPSLKNRGPAKNEVQRACP